jgi:hypothetical protein
MDANTALATLPARKTFDDSPEGQAFAKLAPELKTALAGVIETTRKAWQEANEDNPDEERVIACAHILSRCSNIGRAVEQIRGRALALAGLVSVSLKELGAYLVANDEAKLEPFAEVYAKTRLATEKGKVGFAEACRLAKFADATKSMFANALNEKVKVERPAPTDEDKDAVTEHSIDEILAPLARKWAETHKFEVVPPAK